MASDKKKVVIVRKVVKGHGGHHGGSWKVAYADFVTAMMAFFMVMWLLGLDESTRGAIQTYFTNPIAAPTTAGSGAGINPIALGTSTNAGTMQPLMLVSRAAEQTRYEEIGERIREKLQTASGLDSLSAHVEIVVTDEGLRIELLEGEDGEYFFELGSSALRPAAARALGVIATEIRGAPAPVVVEGHTDAMPFGRRGYSNWELSADRANAARRELARAGLGPARFREIRGYADRVPRNAQDPLDPANRRVSLLMPFTTPPPPSAGDRG